MSNPPAAVCRAGFDVVPRSVSWIMCNLKLSGLAALVRGGGYLINRGKNFCLCVGCMLSAAGARAESPPHCAEKKCKSYVLQFRPKRGRAGNFPVYASGWLSEATKEGTREKTSCLTRFRQDAAFWRVFSESGESGRVV